MPGCGTCLTCRERTWTLLHLKKRGLPVHVPTTPYTTVPLPHG